MREQTELLESTLLLDKKGRLKEAAWASSGLFIYNKERLRPASRRTEWEFYQLFNRHWALQAVYGHAPALGLARVTLIDLESGKKSSAGMRKVFPGDSFDLDFAGGEPYGIHVDREDFSLSAGFDGKTHVLRCRAGALEADLAFAERGEAISTALPFSLPWQFNYFYKKNFPDVRGELRLNGRDYALDEETFMVTCSTRGVWPYRHSRVWGCGSAWIDGHLLSVNLGWGLGNTTRATENAIFWDGQIQKLGHVRERCDVQDFMRPGSFHEESGRLHGGFRPLFDHYNVWNLGLVQENRHQVFGEFQGKVILDDGTALEVERMPFFCEHSRGRW